MPEIVTRAGADLFGVVRAGIDATVRAFVIAVAGPGVVPDGPGNLARHCLARHWVSA